MNTLTIVLIVLVLADIIFDLVKTFFIEKDIKFLMNQDQEQNDILNNLTANVSEAFNTYNNNFKQLETLITTNDKKHENKITALKNKIRNLNIGSFKDNQIQFNISLKNDLENYNKAINKILSDNNKTILDKLRQLEKQSNITSIEINKFYDMMNTLDDKNAASFKCIFNTLERYIKQ